MGLLPPSPAPFLAALRAKGAEQVAGRGWLPKSVGCGGGSGPSCGPNVTGPLCSLEGGFWTPRRTRVFWAAQWAGRAEGVKIRLSGLSRAAPRTEELPGGFGEEDMVRLRSGCQGQGS